EAMRYGAQAQQIFDLLRQNANAQAQLKAPIFEEKVVDLILGRAQVTDKPVSKDELLAEDELPEGYGGEAKPAAKAKAAKAPKAARAAGPGEPAGEAAPAEKPAAKAKAKAAKPAAADASAPETEPAKAKAAKPKAVKDEPAAEAVAKPKRAAKAKSE